MEDASIKQTLQAMAELEPFQFEEMADQEHILVGQWQLPLTGMVAALARMAVEMQVEYLLDGPLPEGGLRAAPPETVKKALEELVQGPFCAECGFPSTGYEPVAPCSYCELLLCDDCAVSHDCPFDPNRGPEDEAEDAEESEGEGDF